MNSKWKLPKKQEMLLGLGHPVSCHVDEWGVHHLLAKNELDLFRAQGYTTARDRLFQMDLFRRYASGTLSELFGNVSGNQLEPTLQLRGSGLASTDFLMRLLGLEQAAKDGLSWCSPRTFRSLLAYSEGVNEWIQQQKKQAFSWKNWEGMEYLFREWTPMDSLLIYRLLGFRLNVTWKLSLIYGACASQLIENPERVEQFFPPHSSPSTSIHWDTPSLELLAQSFDQLQAFGMSEGTQKGSLAWVVSGQHTETKSPIIASDPHFLLRQPSTFYQIHLKGGEYNTIGISLPGVCGILSGHNDFISWAPSLARINDADVYMEELDVSQERYLQKDRYLPLVRREEIIQVRGEEAKHRWVRATLRGPLLSDVLRGPLPSSQSYSLRWTGQESVKDIEAILQTNRAQNWDQFTHAMKYARVPAFQYVYADTQGNIGALLAGNIPIRKQQKTSLSPLLAAQGANDWQGSIPFDELPKEWNPAKGWIVAGSKPFWDQDDFQQIPGWWKNDSFFARGEQQFQRMLQEKCSDASISRLMADQYCFWYVDWIQQHLLPYLPNAQLNPSVYEMVDLLLHWNGRVGKESIATSFFMVFQRELIELVMKPFLGESLLRKWLEIVNEVDSPLRMISQNWSLWSEEEPFRLFDQAFSKTHELLSSLLGSSPQKWQWGNLHFIAFRPLFFWDQSFQSGTQTKKMPSGGNENSVFVGDFSWQRPHFEQKVGPIARQIIYVNHWNSSKWVLFGGQQESLHSSHSQDQLVPWFEGEWLERVFTEEEVIKLKQYLLVPSSQ